MEEAQFVSFHWKFKNIVLTLPKLHLEPVWAIKMGNKEVVCAVWGGWIHSGLCPITGFSAELSGSPTSA